MTVEGLDGLGMIEGAVHPTSPWRADDGGQLKSPLLRYRMRAASETIWSNAGWMKSANWISATGNSP